MQAWGIDMSDPEAMFKECDADGKGMVLFNEFSDWAIKKNLDLEDDDDNNETTNETAPAPPKTMKHRKPPKVMSATVDTAGESSVEEDPIWAELRQKLPWRKTEKEKKMREEQWRRVDVNGNGLCSLAEIDKGMRDVIKLPAIFDLKPVMLRAFTAAKNKVKSSSKHGADYVQKAEYRYLLKYLREYYEYWIAFDRIDKDDDRRISVHEFIQATDMLKAWGIDMTDPEARWRECDADGKGMVLFNEFSDWAIKKSLDLEDDDNNDEKIDEPAAK
jgi:hypothetical protein